MKQKLLLEQDSIDIFEGVMLEFHKGKLKDSNGVKIKDKQQAINYAIEQSQSFE